MKARVSQQLLGLALALAYAAAFACAGVRDGLVIEWAAAGLSGLGAVLFVVKIVELLRSKPPPPGESTRP